MSLKWKLLEMYSTIKCNLHSNKSTWITFLSKEVSSLPPISFLRLNEFLICWSHLRPPDGLRSLGYNYKTEKKACLLLL